MARIRSIKPAFFTSEDISDVTIPARLLFIGLWTEADKLGRLECRPKQLKARLFPHDVIRVEPLLEELESCGLIQVYHDEDDLHSFIAIPTWERHQRVHPKEPDSDIPTPPVFKKPGKKPASPEKPGSIPSGPVGREGKGMEGDLGREGNGAAATPPRSAQVLSPLDYAKLQRHNAYVGARLRVPHKLHGDFVAALGGMEPDAALRGWYATVDAEIEASGEAIVPDVWKWLDARFRPWAASVAVPVVRAADTVAAAARKAEAARQNALNEAREAQWLARQEK
jgi:hypothetical protein